MKNEDLYYRPRHFKSINIWSDVSENEWNDARWQRKNSIKTIDQLKAVIKLNQYQIDEITRTIRHLRSEGKETLRITPYYASLMNDNPFHPGLLEGDNAKNKIDPIFWQSVPTPANLLFPDTGAEGAMCEGSRSFGSAYQRYPNRVALFVAENTSCASYCNHCQRSKSLDSEANVNIDDINKGLFYINYNQNINEVLVTGGDALMISADLLSYILTELSKIQHLRVIRIATRVPVVMPMGVTDDLLELINNSANKYSNGFEKYVYFMTHVNHYKEITEDLSKATRRIRQHGFTIRNQTVLLNHVNDKFKSLAETFRRMFWVGIHPYYLLQCHKEKGIVHFITPVQIGKIYMKHLQGWLSGITMPKYAANIEGGGGKVMLMPSGHDTLNLNVDIEDELSESYAMVKTWDGRKIYKYESLGRAKREEFLEGEEIMNKFIGRKGVFLPKLIIVDENGNHIETSNRTELPKLEKMKKSALLNYKREFDDMPLTNPNDIREKLENLYNFSEIKSNHKKYI